VNAECLAGLAAEAFIRGGAGEQTAEPTVQTLGDATVEVTFAADHGEEVDRFGERVRLTYEEIEHRGAARRTGGA
jgi:hypothetical protein